MTPFYFSVVACTVATAPLMFIPSFKKLSWLSMLGCISTVLVTITVLAAVGMDPFREKQPIQVLNPFPQIEHLMHRMRSFFPCDLPFDHMSCMVVHRLCKLLAHDTM